MQPKDSSNSSGRMLSRLIDDAMRSHGPSSCLMVELCRQNDALEQLHAVLAAATFGADRLASAQSDDEVLAVLASVVQTAGLTGVSICVNESPEPAQPAWHVAYRWGSAMRPSGTPTLDWSRLTRWQEAFAAGHVIAADLADLPADEKLLLAPLGICAVAAIPIHINDTLESLVIFEDVGQAHAWAEPQQDILRLAAWTLVSGLRRQGAAAQMQADAFSPEVMGNLAVSCVDGDGMVCSWNAGAEAMFNCPVDKAIGRPWADLVAGDASRDDIAHELQHAMASHEPMEKDVPYVRADGTPGRLLLAAWPVTLEPDTPGLMLAGVDMTAIRQRQENDMQLGRESLQAHKMDTVSQLVSGLAHHTNNALTVIQGNAELIRSLNPHNADLASMVEQILGATQNTASLMTRLEAYSQQESGPTGEVDLHALLETMVAELTADGVSVSLDCQAENHRLRGSGDQLHEALENLLANAQDAVATGGEITITTENVDFDEAYCALQTRDIRPGEYLCITVEDTGTGMDNQTLQRAFEPFFTTKAFGQGHGLGLATVYGCVRHHHGTVLLTSTSGQGTTVQLFLPVSIAAEPRSDEVDVKTEARKAQIMIIENDAIEGESLSRMLTGAGYGVQLFADADGALAYLAAHGTTLDAVILDANLPDMTARSLLQQIHAHRADITCLVASGLLQAHQAQSLLDEGVSGFLSKPFQAEAVIRLVRRAIG